MQRPLVHFLILGAACFMLSRWWSTESFDEPRPPAYDTVVVSEATIDRMIDEWIVRYGAMPSALERQAMIDAEINDEILFREALRLGLHRADPVVRMRLVQNMRFLNGADRDDVSDDERLLGQALALDMVGSDLVVRRRLIQRMQSMLEAAAQPPGPEESREYVLQHPEQFSTSPRFEVSYRFERRSKGALEVAPLHTAVFSTKQLDLVFGTEAAERIASLGPQQWTAPIERSDGTYHVRLDAVIPSRPIDFEHVRERAHHAIMAERSQAALVVGLQRLRSLYRAHAAGEPEVKSDLSS